MSDVTNEVPQNESLEEMKKRAESQFSKEEIEQYMNMGETMASKAVLTALMEVVKDGPKLGCDKAESEKLCKKIKKTMKYNYSGYTSVTFDRADTDGDEYTLNIQLTISEPNYKHQLRVPHEKYIKEIYEMYDSLKKTAQAFWATYIERNSELFKRICHYRKDVDFSMLKIDPSNKTTLYFDPECGKRVSLLTYYVDSRGNILRMV